MTLIRVIDPSTGETSMQESNDTVLCHATDSDGNYLGLIELEPGMQHASGPPPSDAFIWSSNSWQPKPLTLDQLKDLKWEDIKLARIAAFDAPLVTPYGTFDSYPQARQDIADAVLLSKTAAEVGSPTDINFTLADNTVVALDTTKMITVGLMLGSKVQTVRGIATALRDAIYSAASVEELDAIVWPE